MDDQPDEFPPPFGPREWERLRALDRRCKFCFERYIHHPSERGRCASACGVLGRRATRSSSDRSTSVRLNGARVLIVRLQNTPESIRATLSSGCALVQVRTLGASRAAAYEAGSISSDISAIGTGPVMNSPLNAYTK